MDVTTTACSSGETLNIRPTNFGSCSGGHTWTFGGAGYVLTDGTLCDCGASKYVSPKHCDKCGHQLQN